MVEKKLEKKAALKKAVSKKSSTKKVEAKKATVKKVATKKATTKEVAVKKSTAKKVATKKTTLSVTLIRSFFGRLPTHRATINGLGLKRINHTVELQDTPEVRGMINKVSYLLKVKE